MFDSYLFLAAIIHVKGVKTALKVGARNLYGRLSRKLLVDIEKRFEWHSYAFCYKECRYRLRLQKNRFV